VGYHGSMDAMSSTYTIRMSAVTIVTESSLVVWIFIDENYNVPLKKSMLDLFVLPWLRRWKARKGYERPYICKLD
jgi:hypothetical protein